MWHTVTGGAIGSHIIRESGLSLYMWGPSIQSNPYCICQFPNVIPYQQLVVDKELIVCKVVLINKDPYALVSFCPEGFLGIGVPIDTDAFVRSFVAKTCRDIIDDVEKLDVIQDDFTHFQLLRFCQVTRLQYINSHITRCFL